MVACELPPVQSSPTCPAADREREVPAGDRSTTPKRRPQQQRKPPHEDQRAHRNPTPSRQHSLPRTSRARGERRSRRLRGGAAITPKTTFTRSPPLWEQPLVTNATPPSPSIEGERGRAPVLPKLDSSAPQTLAFQIHDNREAGRSASTRPEQGPPARTSMLPN